MFNGTSMSDNLLKQEREREREVSKKNKGRDRDMQKDTEIKKKGKSIIGKPPSIYAFSPLEYITTIAITILTMRILTSSK